MFYTIFCRVLVIVLGGFQSFFGILLLTSRDVSGMLFGGIFRDLVCLSSWLFTTIVLLVLILLRFAGARVALLCASGVQMLSGITALLNYPDDANGDLIFSPAENEIFLMITILGALFLISVYITRFKYFSPGSCD